MLLGSLPSPWSDGVCKLGVMPSDLRISVFVIFNAGLWRLKFAQHWFMLASTASTDKWSRSSWLGYRKEEM